MYGACTSKDLYSSLGLLCTSCAQERHLILQEGLDHFRCGLQTSLLVCIEKATTKATLTLQNRGALKADHRGALQPDAEPHCDKEG